MNPEPSTTAEYPAAEYDVLLRDGSIAHVRPLDPTDRPALHELVERSSDRSAYLRFFTGGTATAHAYMDRVTKPEQRGRALVATVRDRLVAIAEYFPDGEGTADLGILIDDAIHGQGLGTLLLEHLAADAAENDVRELTAEVLATNHAMLKVLDDLGLEVWRSSTAGTVRIRVPLAPTPRLRAMIAARDHEAERASLARIMNPRSVAVIGAGRAPGGVGHRVLRNLMDGGFAGPIYPVNPRAAQVAGLTAHPSMSAVPGQVDLAVVAVPAAQVLDVAKECAEAGVAGLVVLSAGFAEIGRPDAEGELLRLCRSAGMRLVGPNCLGVLNNAENLNATFLSGSPAKGGIAVLSQSGAVAAAMIDRLGATGLGVSSFVSVGNKADVSGNDLLEYWEDDPATDVIALYLESFGNPRKFARIAHRVAARKPILLVKSGRTGAGDRAVRSHTAAAATPDVAVDALVEASGVIRLDSVTQQLDLARLFATQPLPAGSRVAIVGNSGGIQAMAADACERRGLAVPELPRELFGDDIRPSAALGNPVDLTAEATAEEIGAAVEAVLGHPGVDTVLVVYTPPFGSGAELTKRAIADATRSTGKTVLACVVGHDDVIDGRIPAYAFPEQAVDALARAVAYAGWRARPAEPDHHMVSVDRRTAREIVLEELSAHPEGRWLPADVTSRLLGCYGITLTPTIPVGGAREAERATEETGLPAVLKATGPDLVHKSDIGAVHLNLATAKEVGRCYRELSAALGERMTGAIVQRMLPDGVELIVGGVNYPAFGPLVMAGMGGVTADLLADRAFRVPPLSLSAATQMLDALRCRPLLYGYRGSRPVHVRALADQIVRVGHLLEDLPQVAELDLNPVIATPTGATTVDARVRLAPCRPTVSPLRRHLR
ncbi:GNAT family N-acetyltransferase [Spongiactinospora sp. TRM90649]|uniref:bifunctional acetate--CoA ligase family protein/GNAT family N-acetyltransferase n=1 Tax=Spongiactinospora sp. TRM90649 TaxID=3031114 RepID=UPI0023FA4441|nr:GNAT family N-acetyltransferase [Spongiactinospora sp. TRM90649]MDF5755217.1 GNAT family N-acetyltransferase [Spongiactinospora sp. TRM90649]